MTAGDADPAGRWRVSLHGGHSSDFSRHATSPLRAILEAAVERGYHTFGVTEHAPASEARFLYEEEIEAGYDVERRQQDFEQYARASATLAAEFASRLIVLRGFETEAVPSDSYVDDMLALRERHDFDYIVGSVHHVDELPIDVSPELFEQAVAKLGGLERLVVRYYETVAELVERLRPEVAGHLDLPRLCAPDAPALEGPRARKAADAALDAIAAEGSILDVNTAGYRKGLGSPYPAEWLLRRARERGIGFCFGDDSHDVEHGGFGLDEAREYLLANGVEAITTLVRGVSGVERELIPLR
jgi:histidinol-phosphatase (PHP family)